MLQLVAVSFNMCSLCFLPRECPAPIEGTKEKMAELGVVFTLDVWEAVPGQLNWAILQRLKKLQRPELLLLPLPRAKAFFKACLPMCLLRLGSLILMKHHILVVDKLPLAQVGEKVLLDPLFPRHDFARMYDRLASWERNKHASLLCVWTCVCVNLFA